MIILLGEVYNLGSFFFKENMSVLDVLMCVEGVIYYVDVIKICVIVDKILVVFDFKVYLDKLSNDIMLEFKVGFIIYVLIMVDDVNIILRIVYIMGEV